MILHPDEDETNADWTKQHWDLPAYKSVEFMRSFESSGMTLEQFRALPVYKFAVKRGLIVDDEWCGKEDGYE